MTSSINTLINTLQIQLDDARRRSAALEKQLDKVNAEAAKMTAALKVAIGVNGPMTILTRHMLEATEESDEFLLMSINGAGNQYRLVLLEEFEMERWHEDNPTATIIMMRVK